MYSCSAKSEWDGVASPAELGTATPALPDVATRSLSSEPSAPPLIVIACSNQESLIVMGGGTASGRAEPLIVMGKLALPPEALCVGCAIKGGDAAVNRVLAEKVFAGELSANRDMVVLNAAAGLVVAGVVDDIAQGIELAASAIDDGGAATKLDDLIRHTNL